METSRDRRMRGPFALLPALALVAALAASACDGEGAGSGTGEADAAEAGRVDGAPGNGAGSGEEAQQTWAPGPPLARPPGSAGPSASTGGASDASPSAPSPGSEAGSRGVDLSQLGYDFGDPDAPVQIVEFSDFGCGYCRQFHLETYPTLHEEYVETGKVHWKYVPYILGMFGPNAVDAALAGECAGEQDRFVAIRERLFQSQSEWKGADDPRAHFRLYAREEGLDVGRYDSCMEQMRPQERVVASSRLGQQLGIRGTPTFFILGNSVIPGALPLETFRLVLDQVLAEAEAGGGTGGGQ